LYLPQTDRTLFLLAYPTKKYVLHHMIFTTARTQEVDVDATRQQLTCCWCAISVCRTYDLKINAIIIKYV